MVVVVAMVMLTVVMVRSRLGRPAPVMVMVVVAGMVPRGVPDGARGAEHRGRRHWTNEEGLG